MPGETLQPGEGEALLPGETLVPDGEGEEVGEDEEGSKGGEGDMAVIWARSPATAWIRNIEYFYTKFCVVPRIYSTNCYCQSHPVFCKAFNLNLHNYWLVILLTS